MSSDWELVGGDPAPGDPATIAIMGLDIRHTAAAASEVQLVLESVGCQLATSGWQGDASRAFAEAFSKLPGELGLMAISYDDVATALGDYAAQLETIQDEARQSLVRAELARQRESNADGRAAEAGKRSADLSRQSFTISLSENEWEASQNLAAVTANVVAYDHAQQQLDTIRATKRAVAAAHAAAQNDLTRARADSSEARDCLGRERGLIEGLAADHQLAERQAAAAIDTSIAAGLKNASDFQRLGQWTVREIIGASKLFSIVPDVLSGNSQKAIADCDKVLGAIDDAIHAINDIVLPVLAVATLVIGETAAVALILIGAVTLQPELVVGGVVVGVEAAVLTGEIWGAREATSTAEIYLDVSKGALDSDLYATHYIDPDTGELMVTSHDLAFDEAGLGTDLVHLVVPKGASGPMKNVGTANEVAKAGLDLHDGYGVEQQAFSDQSAQLRGGGGSEVTGQCLVPNP